MNKLWQLKKLSTGEYLNDPQPLPESWGSIFGLSGFIDKLSDLSWLGDEYVGMGWFEVGDMPPLLDESSSTVTEWETAKRLLQESDWAMLQDVPMNKNDRIEWIEYRRELREIRLQPGFPEEINWPRRPD